MHFQNEFFALSRYTCSLLYFNLQNVISSVFFFNINDQSMANKQSIPAQISFLKDILYNIHVLETKVF